MTEPTPPTPQPVPLPERVQAILDATSGHTAGPWAVGKVRKYSIYAAGQREAVANLNTWPGVDFSGSENAALIAAGPDLRALLAETAAALAAAEAERDALRAALERVEGDLARERSTHSETIDQRDTAQEAADRLAYALFSIDEIGEHSSSNCPWENAAERLEEMAALGGTQ
ncbi:hypothetical protein [Deinococcus sp. 12RED42]|uniref:hypothetical protein n=1 Tax=Deinococcus sp. 12RED42 TaxID=2745872 RepID=UPI001E4DFCC7|nr:hypothetical protein [Deinococcus sp. 12RED42]MCD0164604.1 hypothetical protein [Deinococcus sp. 12RED42]